jgi:uncharacterized protein YdaU (DUF1376 family)
MGIAYMPFYPGDYLADTMHLNTEEHGAYFLLMLAYWKNGGPLPTEDLQMITRLANDRWTTVEIKLQRFFNVTPTHWQHERINRDLDDVARKYQSAIKAGKASAEARRNRKKQKKSNETATGVERALPLRSNETATGVERALPLRSNETATGVERALPLRSNETATNQNQSQNHIERAGARSTGEKVHPPTPTQGSFDPFSENETPPDFDQRKRNWPDFRMTHPRIFVGRDEDRHWEALFRRYEGNTSDGWGALCDMYDSLLKDPTRGDGPIYLSQATQWLDKNYDVKD